MGTPCSSMGGLGGIYWLAVASAGANVVAPGFRLCRWQASCTSAGRYSKEACRGRERSRRKADRAPRGAARKVTNINVGPDGTTNVQESGDELVEEEHVVEEHEHRQP